MSKEQTTYNQLSTPMKILVWYGWFSLALNTLYFITGFVQGYLGL